MLGNESGWLLHHEGAIGGGALLGDAGSEKFDDVVIQILAAAGPAL